MRTYLAIVLLLIALSPLGARAGESTTIPQTPTTPALPAYLARPSSSSEAAPAVVVLHGCEGYRKRYGQIADELAARGYVAVAIDTLAPRHEKNACKDRAGSRLEADDARATLAWLRDQSFVDRDRLAVMGYSMGAIAAIDLVVPQHPREAPLGLKGAVAYYPACKDRLAENVVLPALILDGSEDTWTPAPPCAALARATRHLASKRIEIVTFAGATHAFNWDLPDREALGHVLRYDPLATKAAFADALRFLDEKLHE